MLQCIFTRLFSASFVTHPTENRNLSFLVQRSTIFSGKPSDRQQELRYHKRVFVVSFLIVVLIQGWRQEGQTKYEDARLFHPDTAISDWGHAAANMSYALNFPCCISSVQSADAALLKRLSKHMQIKPKYCLTDLWELMLHRDNQKASSAHSQGQRCDTLKG